MSYEVNCAGCQAIVGACIDCGGCFRRHCRCAVCQHGHTREDINACAFCRPALSRVGDTDLLDAEVAGERPIYSELGGPGPEDKDEEEPPDEPVDA